MYTSCSQPFCAHVPPKQKSKNWITPNRFLNSILSNCIFYTICLKCYLFVPFIKKVVLIKICLIFEMSSLQKWLYSIVKNIRRTQGWEPLMYTILELNISAFFHQRLVSQGETKRKKASKFSNGILTVIFVFVKNSVKTSGG